MVHNVMQQILHRHEHAVVIGRRRKDKVAAPERRGEDVVRRDDRGVKHTHRHSALAELCGEDVRSCSRISSTPMLAGLSWRI